MGPKKDKVKEKPTSKTIKCVNYDTGYCKFGEECFKIHPDKVCEDQHCFSGKSNKRHPNPCKFGPRCKFNRKKIYLYSHVISVSDDGKCNILEKKFNKKFAMLENKTTEVINNFEKSIHDKFTLFEKQISNLRKDLETKNAQISALEIKMEELETNHDTQKKKT